MGLGPWTKKLMCTDESAHLRSLKHVLQCIMSGAFIQRIQQQTDILEPGNFRTSSERKSRQVTCPEVTAQLTPQSRRWGWAVHADHNRHFLTGSELYASFRICKRRTPEAGSRNGGCRSAQEGLWGSGPVNDALHTSTAYVMKPFEPGVGDLPGHGNLGSTRPSPPLP